MKFSRVAVVILVVVWGIVLLVPPLNLLLRAQVQGSDLIPFSVTPFMQNVPDFWSRAALRHPNEKSVLVQAALEQGEGIVTDETQRTKVRRLATLTQKYPDDPKLLVMQLHTLAHVFRPERVGGELDDYSEKETRGKGYVSPERTKQKTNFTPGDFQQALEICRQGRKVDPDNAYFDWMECFFLMQLWRDKEALAALEAAANKPRFDEYGLETVRQGVHARSIALGRLQVVEEKYGTVDRFDWSHSRIYRPLARLLAWEAIKARRRGDHDQAIKIVDSGSRTIALIRKSANTILPSMVIGAISEILWSPFWHDTMRSASFKNFDERKQFQYKALQEYVAAQGRPEFAVAARQSRKISREFQNEYNEYSQSILEADVSQSLWSIFCWQTGVLLLLTLLSGVSAYGLTVLGSRVLSTRDRLSLHSQLFPINREVCFGVLGMLASILSIYLAMITYMGFYLWKAGQELEGTFFEFMNFMQFDMPLLALYTTLGNIPKSDAPWRLIICGMPLLFAILYAVKSAIRWQQRQSSVPFKSPLVSKLTNGVLVPIFLLGWASLAINFKTEDEFPWRLLVSAGIVVCAACIFFAQYRRWHSLPQRRAAMGYGWQLLQRSLLVWLVVGSVLYLTIALVSLPMRLQAEVRMDRFLSVGEVKEGKILQ